LTTAIFNQRMNGGLCLKCGEGTHLARDCKHDPNPKAFKKPKYEPPKGTRTE
jgi:hypothetical protein